MNCNDDANFFADSAQTMICMVVCDSEGVGIAFHTLLRQDLMGVDEEKTWGVYETLRWEIQMGFSEVIVEMDTQ